jgi:hypothetical protein
MTNTKPWPLDPFFCECLNYCAADPQFVRNFDRLLGTNLQRRGSGLEVEIDKATGRLDHELRLFAEFVRDYVYAPVRAEIRLAAP